MRQGAGRPSGTSVRVAVTLTRMEVEPRPLTEREAAVLHEMLRGTPFEATVIDELRVVGKCDCGCPTIHFTDQPNTSTIAHARVADTDDTLLLFADGVRLSSLELAWVSDEPPDELPPASSVTRTTSAGE